MPEQAPACGNVAVVIHEADDRDQGTPTTQRDERVDALGAGQHEPDDGQQEGQDNGDTTATGRRYGMRAAGIGHVDDAACQGVAAQACGHQQGQHQYSGKRPQKHHFLSFS
ncbi:hypothetical protein D3C80_1421330 [compost metagenome]